MLKRKCLTQQYIHDQLFDYQIATNMITLWCSNHSNS